MSLKWMPLYSTVLYLVKLDCNVFSILYRNAIEVSVGGFHQITRMRVRNGLPLQLLCSTSSPSVASGMYEFD